MPGRSRLRRLTRLGLHVASNAVSSSRPRILIVGGGYVGLYTALRLQRKLTRGAAEIIVVDPQPHMTYQPFLPEAAAGSIEPRHVVVPLRRVLKHCTVVTGAVTGIAHRAHTATVLPSNGAAYDIGYDILVVAPGSVARTLPIPGLAEGAIGFKNVGEAIFLRNQVLSCLDIAASTTEQAVRRRALTFTFVGGGYAGIEAFAELEDMARYAVKKYYPQIKQDEMRWVLVEASTRILPEVSLDLAAYTVEQLLRRGMDVRLNTRLESMVGGHVVLGDGDSFECDTVVWTAGVKPNPLLVEIGLPLDAKGRIECEATLRVRGLADAWSAGDCASVPDLSVDDPEARTAPSAQHAVRQAKVLADNIVSVVRGGATSAYSHKNAGSVASLGLYKGVAQIYGIKLKGIVAWFLHRTYHVSRVPTFNRKIRVLADWTLALLFRREITSLGQIQDPRKEFADVAGADRRA
ncbi:MAG: NAD(P)/FAD-dependent oxidoreductase [Geodermatophilaceae bacterium]|nr:NAD(P)/FAD-dependent oxidoreductase [Geodermatophilaceae bacterium]